MAKSRLTDPDEILAEKKAAIQRIWRRATEHAEQNGIATMDAVNLLLLARVMGQRELSADIQRACLYWDKERLLMWVINERQWPERGTKPAESALLFDAICRGELVKISRWNAELVIRRGFGYGPGWVFLMLRYSKLI